jgi:tetratricopeptide (TPR) repeat protein/tRNA A-37 threonylcarbamoyl transferase component Bud32
LEEREHVDPLPETQTVQKRNAAAPEDIRPLEQVGHYRIKRLIASGGMGTVYEATQDSPRRVVAVKVMKPGLASRAAMRRFEFEAHVLGRLRHPGIAQIYEAGTHCDHAGSVPYFAMEYIPNAKPLTRFVTEHKLGTRQRIGLFAQVCDAVHHGHQKGVIHRDLKPSNILVDASGQVKIIDFGVARGTDSDLSLTTQCTDVGQLIGTLQYMSPEQCAGDPHDIDTRSDVYALGVVFFELLTGQLPYDVREEAIHEATRVIREEQPARLSTFDRTLRGDVETIAFKALEKDRARRYQSASDFGRDIERYLANKPIQARPPSVVYRFRKFVRRRRVPVAAAAAIVLAFGVGADRQIRASWAESVMRTRETAYSVFLAAQPDEALSNPRKIIADCTRAIEIDPSLALAYALRAKALTLADQDEAAWRDAKQAVEIEPNNAYAQRTLAHVHLMRGEFEQARDAYERGFQKFVMDTDLPRDLHNRARVHSVLGDYEQALRYHDGAIALAPHASRVHVSRGLTRLSAGHVESAIADFQVARSLDAVKWAFQVELWTWEMLTLRAAAGDREQAAAALAAADAAARTPLEIEVVAIYRDNSNGEAALAAARTDAERGCVYYYLGSKALLDGRAEEAHRLLQKTLEIGGGDMPESDLARWHLTSFGKNGADAQ